MTTKDLQDIADELDQIRMKVSRSEKVLNLFVDHLRSMEDPKHLGVLVNAQHDLINTLDDIGHLNEALREGYPATLQDRSEEARS